MVLAISPWSQRLLGVAAAREPRLLFEGKIARSSAVHPLHSRPGRLRGHPPGLKRSAFRYNPAIASESAERRISP
jgi:hypothetical protein